MTIDQVIESGKKVSKSKGEVIWNKIGDNSDLVIVCLLALLAWIWSLTERADLRLFVLVGTNLFVFCLVCFCHHKYDSQKSEVDKWKERVAYPFIKSLPVEKKELIHVKLVPYEKVRDSNFLWNTLSAGEIEGEKTPVIIAYKDNGRIIERADYLEIRFDPSLQIPYVEYRKLTQDLGHEVSVGIYNAVVYLPEDYRFSDLK